MSDELRIMANDHLLQAVVLRLMLLDPGFAQDARQWFDTMLGRISDTDLARASDPQFIATLRKEYMQLLAKAEEQACTVAAKQKSTRRRIFEWLERG